MRIIMNIKNAICILSIFLSSNALSTEEKSIPLPLGVSFGMTLEQTKSFLRGYDLTFPRGYPNTIVVDNPDSQNFIYKRLGFYFNKHGLQYVQVQSKTIGNDPYGRNGVTLYYSEKKRILTDNPSLDIIQFEFADRRNTYDKTSFYQCLNYLNCGKYKTYLLKGDEVKVLLSLNPKSDTEGYINIDYKGDYWDR